MIKHASFEQEAGIESHATDDIGLEEESDPGESDASTKTLILSPSCLQTSVEDY